MLHRLQELVLRRIVDSAHMTGHTEKMHREEGAIEENIRQDKMNLPERLIGHSAEHFRKPIIHGGKQRKDDSRDYVMKMSDDIIGIVNKDIDRCGCHEDAAQTADQKV